MSQYSEMIGSFLRTANYPMEADYIFDSEESLVSFYSDPMNKVILHEGLFKIVKTSDGQSLYWVIDESGELIFKKLIDNVSIDTIEDDLKKLQEKLDKEIQDRIDKDNEIYGTEDLSTIPGELNNILKISQAITDLTDKENNTKEELKAVVGTDQDDIIQYLQTLDYKNLTEVSQALNKFLNTIDDEDISINTLPELKEFLRGFEYTHNLYECFVDFWNNIQGDPTPNTQFRTLRGIQDFVEALASANKNRLDNLQKELNDTQVGVGLDSSGLYSPDNETNYLKNATSVMNALRILDSLINQAINNCNIEAKNTDTVDISIIKEQNKTTISAQVKASSETGNDILLKNDGIYHNIDSEYENGILTIKVNGNVRQQHVLGLSSVVDRAYYDTDQESIVIIFKLQNGETQTVTIPASSLISEWEVDNSIPGKVVELTKERVVSGGADKLSADVRISEKQHNILVKDGNTLYVNGSSDNIVYDGDVTVKSKLDSLSEHDSVLDSQVSTLDSKINNEIQRSTEKDDLLTQQLNDEIQRATNLEKEISNKLDSEIKRSTDKDLEHEESIRNEYDRALAAETKIIQDLNNEIQRSTNKDEKHDESITKLTSNLSDLNTKVDSEITRATTSENLINQNLQKEVDRATDSETQLQTSITNEITRATDAEDLLSHRIDDLKEYIDTNTDNDANLASKVASLETSLTEEVSRAKLEESKLSSTISQETLRATTKEDNLQQQINSANSDISNNNDLIIKNQQDISDIKLKNQQQDTEISKLNDKVDTIKDNIESNINTKISSLQESLNQEISRSTQEDYDIRALVTTNTTKIDNEVTRAKAQEQAIRTEMSTKFEVSNSIQEQLKSQLQNLEESTLEELNKKIETVELLKSDDLSYSILVDGTSIGTINIPKDQFLQSVDLIDNNILRFVFNTNSGSTVTDIVLSDVFKDALDSINSSITSINNDIYNLSSKLLTEVSDRKTEDSNLKTLISQNTNSISGLSTELNNVESTLTQKVDTALTNANSYTTQEVTKEKDRAIQAELELSNKLNSITIVKDITPQEGFDSSYSLLINNTQVGSKINIPKDRVINSVTIKEVQEINSPYQGAQVGDKYIEFTFLGDIPNQYLPANDLIIKYSQGNGIIINGTTISAKVFSGDKYIENSIDGIRSKGIDESINIAKQDLQNEINQKAPIYSPILTGVPQVEVSPDDSDSSQRIPSTAWVIARIKELAPTTPKSYWLKLEN